MKLTESFTKSFYELLKVKCQTADWDNAIPAKLGCGRSDQSTQILCAYYLWFNNKMYKVSSL